MQRKFLLMLKPIISSNTITSRVSIMSEKCIIYRALKHQKRLKYSQGLKLNFLLMQECWKLVSANCMICVISWSHTPNLSSCIKLVIRKYVLKSQYVKLTQLWPLTVNCVKVGSQSYLAGLRKLCFLYTYI